MVKIKVDEDRLTECLSQQVGCGRAGGVSPLSGTREDRGLTPPLALPEPTPSVSCSSLVCRLEGGWQPPASGPSLRWVSLPNTHGGGALSPDPIPPQRSALETAGRSRYRAIVDA